MKQTLLRYAIVASIGAFLALFMSSCGTRAKYSAGYDGSKNVYQHNYNNRCAAYQ